MKCYITGRSSNVSEVERTIALTRASGHEVTFDWPSLPMIKPYAENPDKASAFATSAIQGIIETDVYILLAHHIMTGQACLLN